ncbi:CAP domain-containing protein [Solibacillus sp. FSL K6-1523]|uniref:CAP domain-containing protein n=1 Tax=Solibacillus sp. FSL K6-1523 TaxID=2921471 RepID=UPI0030FA9904
MKALFRILIVATCLGMVYYYSNFDDSTTGLLEGPNQITQPVSNVVPGNLNGDDLPRPTTGLSTYIGKSSEEIVEQYGKPNRVDVSAFDYEWWVYDGKGQTLMVGVDQEIVTQVYTNDVNFNIAPYQIGQTLDDVYRMTIIEQEVSVKIDENIYMFAMNEMDMQNRILVKYEDVFAQLYIDEEKQQLEGVRFLDGQTLVVHKPYELQFAGELLEASTPSSFKQIEINLANGKQLTELVNSFRQKNELPVLQYMGQLVTIAGDHSEQIFLNNKLTQDTTIDTLTNRLDAHEIIYQHAGENSATNYVDAIEVVHGWINSKEHRDLILNDRFNRIGSGAFVNYFTQIYIEAK